MLYVGWGGMECATYEGMRQDHHTDMTPPQVGGGFGRQVGTTGRPSVIDSIKHLPVTFEEFMKDEAAVEIKTTHQQLDNTEK